MESKFRAVDDTGANTFLTSCSDCRHAFDDRKRHLNRDKTPASEMALLVLSVAAANNGSFSLWGRDAVSGSVPHGNGLHFTQPLPGPRPDPAARVAYHHRHCVETITLHG